MRPGELIDGRYRVEAEIGAGGMGVVFRALDEQTRTRVALKLISDPDSGSARFVREVELLAQLDHPAIVHSLGTARGPEGLTILVMEWVDGQSLEQRLTTTGLSVAETIAMAKRVASALGQAHERGIIHRDLKPTNILLPGGDPAQAKVIDFGIARRIREQTSLTRTGQVVGSPGYLAPEQAAGSRQIDARADVFAFGCVLYECLAGVAAFPGTSVVAVLAKVLMTDPPPLGSFCPEAPPGLLVLVDNMLDKDLALRPPDARAVLAALEALAPLGPGTSERRRARVMDEAPTIEAEFRDLDPPTSTGNEPWQSLVVAAIDEGEEADAEASATQLFDMLDARREFQDIAQRHKARVEPLANGAVLARLEGLAGDVVPRAAALALAIRAELPEASMALVSGPLERDWRRTLDAAGQALQSDALGALFGGTSGTGPPPGGVRIDARTATHLQGFHTRKHRDQQFLLPE